MPDPAYGTRPAFPANKGKKRSFLDDLSASTGAGAPAAMQPQQAPQYQQSGTSADPLAYRAERSARDTGVQPYSEAGLDQSTADFRANRHARDRMAGLNIGQVAGGERVNPMMPGVPMGAVNPNYGGIGKKAKWFEDQALMKDEAAQNVADPEARRNTVLDAYFGFHGRSALGIPLGNASIMAQKDPGTRQKLGLEGDFGDATRDTLSRMTPEQRAAQSTIRATEQGRVAAQRGDVNDPNSRAGMVFANARQGMNDRNQRMAGPTQEQWILNAAMNGNRNAVPLAGMMAQGNRDAARNRSEETVAGINNPVTPPLSPIDQYRSGLALNPHTPGTSEYDQFNRDFATGGPPAEPGGMSPRDIAANPDMAPLSKLVSGSEVQEIGSMTDPQAIIAYGRAKGWKDEKINKILKVKSHKRMSVDSPSGWGNVFGNYQANPDTGVMESDLQRWKNYFGM